jgi:hypothetical protein
MVNPENEVKTYSAGERIAIGRALRDKAPRQDQAKYQPPPYRKRLPAAGEGGQIWKSSSNQRTLKKQRKEKHVDRDS